MKCSFDTNKVLRCLKQVGSSIEVHWTRAIVLHPPAKMQIIHISGLHKNKLYNYYVHMPCQSYTILTLGCFSYGIISDIFCFSLANLDKGGR